MSASHVSDRQQLFIGAAITYGYVVLWITLSAAVILINKSILDSWPFPITLTMSHMAFCSSLAALLVKTGFAQSINMERDTYIRAILPIAALFTGTLWLGNSAYIYLSVSFIQMVKATMPAAVFVVGILVGAEKYSHKYAATLVVVTAGVATASYGELAFNLVGFLLQTGSIVTESFRLCLIQLLLQSRGIKLNPVTTLFYIAPACFCFLSLPFAVLELPKLMTFNFSLPAPWLMLSCVVAFGLNMSVFLLIGRSSALTMNLAGIVKDWLLIWLSVVLFGSPVTKLQLCGYGVAFAGITFYNVLKMQQATAALAAQQQADTEKQALLGGSKPDESK